MRRVSMCRLKRLDGQATNDDDVTAGEVHCMGLLAGTRFDRPPHCERCEKPETECQCPPLPPSQPERRPPQTQTARVAVERRKHGRQMTVVRGLKEPDTDLSALFTRLKSACGAGGAMQGDDLEIQGDHLARVANELQSLGYRVR
jgi:translation initiation factor 1